MSSSLKNSLALRLTLWYAGIFAASSLLIFSLVYVYMLAVVQERTDDELTDDIEEFTEFMQAGGLEQVGREFMAETQGEEAENTFFRLWTPSGQALLVTDLSAWPGLNSVPREVLVQAKEAEEPITQTLTLAEREHQVRSIVGRIGPDHILQIGESLEDDEELISALRNGLLIALLAVMVLGAPIGWFMARRSLRGVQEITQIANEIIHGDLDQRVPVRSQSGELAVLAQTFNTMLDRIQALITGMREMTDNLAHDLRSPLGRIRAAAETSLSQDSSQSDFEALAVNTAEECDRLLEMINTTLDIAEAESGAAKLQRSEIDLVALIHNAIELFQPIADDKQITLRAELPEDCLIWGDRQRLQRVVANLLDNALKYNRSDESSGASVTIKLCEAGQQIKLTIEDTGIGIAPEETARIFERYYRCDQSRSESGNGLGLSLALAFVRAHGGSILVNSQPGQGSTFTAVLAR